MSEPPYSGHETSDLILRDHLAIDRTVLANERTFLAYVRTALALVILGATFLQFLEHIAYHLIGGFFIVMGVFAVVVGIWRFHQVRRRLAQIRPMSGLRSQPDDGS